MRTERTGIRNYVHHNAKYNRCVGALVNDIFQNETRDPCPYFQTSLLQGDAEPVPAPAPNEMIPVASKDYGPTEHEVLTKLAYGSFTNVVLSGEIGCGKTELRRYVLSELASQDLHSDCKYCQIRPDVRPLVINFLKGYDTQDLNEVLKHLWAEMYDQLLRVLSAAFVAKDLIGPFAEEVHHGKLARQLTRFWEFVNKEKARPEFDEKHPTQKDRNEALFAWINQNHSRTRDGVVLLAWVGRFVRAHLPCKMSCFVSAFDNLDYLRTSNQIQLVIAIASIQEIARFRTLYAVRPELEGRFDEMAGASFVFDRVRHLGTDPSVVCQARMQDFLESRWPDPPQVSLHLKHTVRPGTTVLEIKPSDHLIDILPGERIEIRDSESLQSVVVESVDAAASRLKLAEPLRYDFGPTATVVSRGRHYRSLVHEKCMAHATELRSHIDVVTRSLCAPNDFVSQTFKNMSCRSIRRSLKLAQRLFVNHAVDYLVGPAKIAHLRSALMIGESDTGNMEVSDDLAANLFVGLPSERFSLLSVRILQLLLHFRNTQSACPLTGLKWDLLAINSGWSDEDVRNALNYLMRPYVQLLYIRGRDRYEDERDYSLHLGDHVFLTELGEWYLTRMLFDIRYLQEALLPVQWRTEDAIPTQVDWSLQHERFRLLVKQLHVVVREDVEEFRVFRDNVGLDTLHRYGAHLVSSVFVGQAAKAMLNSFPDRKEIGTRELYRDWASLVNVCNENERNERRISNPKLTELFDLLNEPQAIQAVQLDSPTAPRVDQPTPE